MKSEVKFGTLLDDGFVTRREEHMVIGVDLRYGNDEHSMIFTGITIYYCSTAISTVTIRTKHLFIERFLEVCK